MGSAEGLRPFAGSLRVSLSYNSSPFLARRVARLDIPGSCGNIGPTIRMTHETGEDLMAIKKGTGLLMVWREIPEHHEDEFNRWNNEEHLPERQSVPGFLSLARYEAVSGGPKHLAVYELESPAVLESPEYLKLQEEPTEWSNRMSPSVVGTIFIRNVYEMIHPAEVSPETAQADMAPVLQIGRMAIPPDVEDDFNNWYNTIYVPNYEKVPGCIRARRYRAVVGEPRYSVMYELEHDKVSQSPEWLYQQTVHPDNAKMRQAMQHEKGSPGIWKKSFEL